MKINCPFCNSLMNSTYYCIYECINCNNKIFSTTVIALNNGKVVNHQYYFNNYQLTYDGYFYKMHFKNNNTVFVETELLCNVNLIIENTEQAAKIIKKCLKLINFI